MEAEEHFAFPAAGADPPRLGCSETRPNFCWDRRETPAGRGDPCPASLLQWRGDAERGGDAQPGEKAGKGA